MKNKTISTESELYIFILFFLWLSLIIKIPIIALIVSCASAIYFGNKLILQKKEDSIPRICVNLLVFQNFCIGIIAHFVEYSSDNLKFLSQIPFVVISIMAVLCIYYKKIKNRALMLKSVDVCFLGLLLAIILSSILSEGHIGAKLICIRNYVYFYFAYVIGESCINNKK